MIYLAIFTINLKKLLLKLLKTLIGIQAGCKTAIKFITD